MFWPILAALLLLAIFAIHFSWQKKFNAALAGRDNEISQLEQSAGDKSSRLEAQQRALFNSMVEGLLLLDNTGRIQLANRALENLFNVSFAIYGKTILEAFRNHQLAELAERLHRERHILDFEFELSQIEPRWFQINASLILDEHGNLNGSVFVFHELTRLKQLEKTRQEFVANVSHELRTPLSMIKGYVETLLEGAKDNPEVSTKFLTTIDKHTDRLTFLIEDLLTISKLESGQIVLNLQRGELYSAVERVIQDLQSAAMAKGVRLENRIPQNLSVLADFERLEQVFWNLIENGIKYGKANGSVVIGARNENEKVEIWVTDDGPGIAPEAKDRVFERFYRADKARSREQGGTGLGLAIVKHVVQKHGGEVWVESEVGTGSSFHLTLTGGSPWEPR